MTATILRANHPLNYVPGQRVHYGDENNTLPKEYLDFMNVVKTSKQHEDFIGSSGFGLPTVKPEGVSVSFKSLSQGISNRIQYATYAIAFAVSHESMADQVDGLNIVTKATRKAAKAMIVGKDQLAANMLDDGFDTAVTQNGGDGKPLFSATHVRSDGGAYSNLITAADLGEAALESALIQARRMTDDNGLRTAIKVQKLIISPEEQFNAERILKSMGRVSTADNDINAIRSSGLLPGGAVVNDYKTDTDAWFLITDQNNSEGLIMLDRESVKIDADSDFKTGSDLYKLTEAYAVGWANPRAALGSAGV